MSTALKVLLIEDFPTDAELAEREIVKEFGPCEFRQVETEEDCLSALETFYPDIIISDYMMPRFDGMTALKIAKERAPEVPFIVFTGSMNEDTAVACMKAGAWDYVIKEHIKRLGPAVRAALQEKELRRERENARIEAEKAYRVKREFLANISHELRTPLNGIVGMFTILESLNLGKEERHWIAMAKQAADNLNRIVVDLLNFIQLESKRVVIEKTAFSVEELVASVMELFLEEAGRKGMGIDYENRCSQPEFIGDRGRTAQIVWNLLSNAVKFSKQGRIRVETKEKNGALSFVIEDEGIGIENERLSDIFFPLHQLENPYTKTHSGIGIGLSIVKNLVDLMEGEIHVESTPGIGSRFEVTIPGEFTENGIGEKQEQQAEGFPLTEKGTILAVEDEAINRLFVCTILKKHGFRVIEARDGQEAIDAARAARPDLILMDIGLPTLDGLEAAKRILQDKKTKDIPIIALTAHARPEEKERFLKGGMVEVITKPYKPPELIEAVRRYAR